MHTIKRVALAVSVAIVASLALVVAASAGTVNYTGQGLTADGFGGYDLNKEICGVANGADVEGSYLLWVLTANGASSATITFGAGTGNAGTYAMTKVGGTFKYISPWLNPSTLPNNVSATYSGSVRGGGNVQLVISHGCRPFENGAWCSPGFWRNAEPGAWARVGKSPSDAFDGFVYDYWFGNSLPSVSLGTVLADAPTYSGPPVAGSSGYPLNAFNATGAALTDLIPGYDFDLGVMQAGGSDACPIDHFGNYKVPQS